MVHCPRQFGWCSNLIADRYNCKLNHGDRTNYVRGLTTKLLKNLSNFKSERV